MAHYKQSVINMVYIIIKFHRKDSFTNFIFVLVLLIKNSPNYY